MTEDYMELILVNSLEKVFLDTKPELLDDPEHNIVLQDSTFSFQAAVYPGSDVNYCNYKVEVISEIGDIIKMRQVCHVPSMLPRFYGTGDNYLRDTIGFYPDPLEELGEAGVAEIDVRLHGRHWNSLWFDVTPVSGRTKPGRYPVSIIIKDNESKIIAETSTEITVLNASMKKAQFIHTEWFHTDCLAIYYDIPVFSDDYWRIVGNFMKAAVGMGVNMILTPVFTPPLDTAVGGERLTVQLVDVSFDGKSHIFGFGKLDKWIDLAMSSGIEYFEISHLFTQWGVEHAPKIMVADENGVLYKKFGWETEAAGSEYTGFMSEFIPALRAFLREKNIEEKTYFHISDEPGLWCLEQYKKIHDIMKPLLKGCKIFDALSDADFYKQGLVEIPVVATDHYDSFMDLDIKEKWVYYCSGQNTDVSNRYFSMPSARTRIIGVQFYLYGINGFLQWGLNFYNTVRSERSIDPYAVTDAGAAFPSGDAFMLYPGKGGDAVGSLRSMVFTEGLSDFYVLKQLEGLQGRDYVIDLIHKELNYKITFNKYPRSDQYLIRLRSRVLEEIEERSNHV